MHVTTQSLLIKYFSSVVTCPCVNIYKQKTYSTFLTFPSINALNDRQYEAKIVHDLF